jgi:hypothetical protein
VAVGKVAFFGEARMSWDMSMRSVFRASLLNSASNVERKGLRDIGLLPDESRCWLAGEARAGEFSPGDTALRKGLLEERLSCRPGDGCRSVIRKGYQRSPVSSQRQCTVKQATDGALPGIDGSANMMPLLLATLSAPNRKWS